MLEVNEAITTESIEGITGLIVERVVQLTEANYGTLWLLDVKNNCLKVGAVSVARRSQRACPLDHHSIDGHVALARKAPISGKSYNLIHTTTGGMTISSQNLSVPLVIRYRLIGTLHVESKRRNAFSKYHLGLLYSFADQAAIALVNASVFEQRTKDIKALQEINKNLWLRRNWDKLCKLSWTRP